MTDPNSQQSKIDNVLLDSLLAHIAIIDKNGIIQQTNKAWQTFDDESAQIKRSAAGTNYFDTLQQSIVFGNDYALKLLLGLKKVLKNERDTFTLSYPLQTADKSFWFNMTVHPCNQQQTRFIMMHEDITTSMNAKVKQKENQNRYEVQFNQSLDGILITDTKGNIIDANPAASNILGWEHEELINCTRNDIADVDDPNYQQALTNRKQTGIYKIEMDLKHKQGYKIPAEVSSRSYRNQNGKLRAIVSFRDISRRKAAEHNLLKNKHFTESALNSIPGVFFVMDQQSNFIRWNDNMTTKLGYSTQELANKSALDFVIDDDRSFAQQKLTECIENGEASLEIKIRDKNGDIRDYYFLAKRFVEDDEIYIVGTGIDVTENKMVERENRRNQLMLEQLFDNAPVGIVIADTDNKIKRVNKSFEEIFSYDQEEIVDKNINNLLAPDNKKHEAKAISLATAKGQSLQTETIRLAKDNRKVPVLIGSVPVTLQDETIAIYGIYVDVSEQAEYQQKIEEALHEKEILLSELHHRVKNNLALINSLLDLQLFDTANEELSKELSDVKNRILTIASIHEVLYQNGNLTQIPFNNFIAEIIKMDSNQNQKLAKGVTINADTQNIFLDINQSIPCGLLLNEILSLIFEFNSANQQTEMNIRLREYDSNVHLIIDGENIINCPKEVRENESLHNILIGTLVKQLEGHLLWPNPQGDYQKFELIFTKENGNGPARELLERAE